MTQEVYGAVWQDDVIALAIENSDVDLVAPSGTETLIVRAVFGQGMPSQRKDNSNFTFSVVGSGSSYASVEPTGVVTGTAEGTAIVEVTLTGYPNVEPAYAQITVTNG